MDADWVPFGREPDHRDTLVDGIPAWLDSSLTEWIDAATGYVSGTSHMDYVEVVRTFDRRYRPEHPLYHPNLYPSVVLRSRNDDDLTFAYVDYLVAILGGWILDATLLLSLEAMLEESGSVFRVGVRGGYRGLVKRVAEGTQKAAETTMASSGDAGRLLAEAWGAAFGRKPDAEEAYEKAIKCVEEAAIPVVTPKDTTATLGKMITVMRAQKDWALALVDSRGDHFYELVPGMCEALWRGQPSRHGANGYRKPTQEEAEGAVLLAVPLVQWFTARQVVRRAGVGTP